MFFQPHPYVKLRIGPDSQNIHSPISSQFSNGFNTNPANQQNALQSLPHHGQSRRTQVLENTTDPTWDHEVCTRIGNMLLIIFLNKNLACHFIQVLN